MYHGGHTDFHFSEPVSSVVKYFYFQSEDSEFYVSVCLFLFFVLFCLVVLAFVCFCFFKIGFLCIIILAVLDSVCRTGYPPTHRDPPASTSKVLGLKVCATTPGLEFYVLKNATVASTALTLQINHLFQLTKLFSHTSDLVPNSFHRAHSCDIFATK
jgi:hypothetical protein